jgi:mono/diheme cytochrome c family protein
MSMLRVLGIEITVCILGVGLSFVGHAQPPSTVGRGQFIAAQRCEGCHTMGSVVQGTAVPSFRALAGRPDMTSERLKDLITTPRHPMPGTPLESTELDAVVAYIRSLR